jgi:hypothetical protein
MYAPQFQAKSAKKKAVQKIGQPFFMEILGSDFTQQEISL